MVSKAKELQILIPYWYQKMWVSSLSISKWYHKETMPDQHWYIPPHNIAQFNFISFVAARVAGFELPHMFAALWCHAALALQGTGHMCNLFEFVPVAWQQRKTDETEFQKVPTSDPLHQHFLQVSIPATGYVKFDNSSNWHKNGVPCQTEM